MTTILLAGATGVFGRHLTTALTAAGHDVLGIGRRPGSTIRADINDRDALLAAVAGRRADVVVHAATALAKPPAFQRHMDATDVLRTTGMRTMIEAAKAVGASRFISENVLFGYGYGRLPAPVTEDAPFGPRQHRRHTDAHVTAMRIKEELTFGTPGIDGISLRFGLFYGPGATESLVAMLRKRALPDMVTPGRALSWVHLSDAAAAVLAAIEHGQPGQAYNIADTHPISFGDHVRATAAAFGTPKPMRVPAWVLRPAGLLSEMLRSDIRLDSHRAAAELGWKPEYPTVAAGLAAMTR